MLSLIIALILAAAAIYVAFNAYKSGWDWKKGLAALLAVIAAIAVWAHEHISSMLNGSAG
jgi:hypothetical protein